MIIAYDRQSAVEYAKKWAFSRNPLYYNFDRLGGDCTNFASQCIFAGCGIMNYEQLFGWYYINANNRTPSWTGVQYLYDFLVDNLSAGPFAVETPLENLMIGDIVQLGTKTDDFYHSPVVVAIRSGKIYIAAHSDDVYMRPLSSYNYQKARGIHIIGARTEK